MKIPVFLLCLLPLVFSVVQVYLLQSGGAHSLGADPGKALVHMQGEWAIRLLLLTLLVSPLRQLTGWQALLSVRRMLGLFTFFYATLHVSAYLVLLLELNLANLATDVVKRPYITVGFVAWLFLVPLAVTSTDAMMRRLKKRWRLLHRAVYLVAGLAVVHVFWLARSSYEDAFLYGFLVAVLLLARWFEPHLRLFREAIKPSP